MNEETAVKLKCLRLLISNGDLDSAEARRLVLQVGNALPESTENREVLLESLHLAVDLVLVAHSVHAPDHEERARAMQALSRISERMKQGSA